MRFTVKKDDDKDKAPPSFAGFNGVPKEPPCSACNDVIQTTGDLLENLGDVRTSVTATL